MSRIITVENTAVFNFPPSPLVDIQMNIILNWHR